MTWPDAYDRLAPVQRSVYSKLGRSGGHAAPGGSTPDFEDGVTVSRRGEVLRVLVCDDGGAGFRLSIDWLPMKAVTPQAGPPLPA